MNTFKTAVTSVLLLGAVAQAQVNIPVANVTLDFSPTNAFAINLQLGTGAGSTRAVIADPFKIASAGITGSGATTAEKTSIASTVLWFCMDPLQTIFTSGSVSGSLNYGSTLSSNFNVFSDNGVTSAQIAKGGGLSGTELTDIANLFARNYVAAETSSLKAAALQIAIWEVVNENSPLSNGHPYDLTSGTFSVSNYYDSHGHLLTDSLLLSTATDMLKTITSAPITSSGSLDFLIDGTYDATCPIVLVQDLVGWDPSPIPESSNFATGALGLLGLAAIGKLRSRKAKAAKMVA